ncbi:MAG: SusC/RagA family TonB-linked outer membrane protein [Chitinophagaceae bacterium]
MKLLVLLTCVMLVGITALAQTHFITGQVKNDKGEPIAFATIRIKSSGKGVSADDNGNFRIEVPDNNQTLVISATGYNDLEQKPGSSTLLSISLGAMNGNLQEVFVTALGIKREEKALGYAAQTVKGATLMKSNAGDVLNGLTGQVAGLNLVKSAGSAGAPTFVQIRGQNSLTGDAQPLIVIDGVIIDNSSYDTNGDGTSVMQGGQNYQNSGVQNSNRAVDINPDDIESVTVLKGGAATALYGLRGANGVIVYTTKKGRSVAGKGLSVDYNTSLTMTEVSRLPELQNKYLQGLDGQYIGPQGAGGRSWGPLADTMYWNGDNTYIYDKNGFLVGKNDPTAKTPFVPYNNVNNFFRKGLAYYNSVSVSGGNEEASFRASLSNNSETGIIPTNDFRRTTASLSGRANLTSKFSIEGSGTYVNSNNNAVQEGSNTAGVFLPLYRVPISFDLLNGQSSKSNPEAFEFPDGTQRTYKVNFDNPYWSINKNKFNSNVNRFYGYLQFSYKLASWVTASVKSGMDYYTDNRHQIYDIGSNAAFGNGGRIVDDEITYKHSDNYLNFMGGTKIAKGLKFNYVAGANYYVENLRDARTQGDNLIFPGFDNMSNAVTISSTQQKTKIVRNAVYGSFDFDWKEMLFLTLTGRNDWSSTLPEQNRSFFYPSASVGWVFTELPVFKNSGSDILSFGKLRYSYAKIAHDAPPYTIKTNYVQWLVNDGYTTGLTWPQNNINAFGLNTVLGQPNLKPENTYSNEVGMNLQFLKSRINFDIAYYSNLSKDLIVPVNIAASSGATQAYFNSGEIKSTGVEVVLGGSPFKSKEFEWDINVNFARNRSMVRSLANGLHVLKFLDGFGAGTQQIPGQQVNQLYGNDWLRDSKGNILIDDSGTPASNPNYGYPVGVTDTTVTMGNPNPDWTMGINNSFTFRGFNLSFLWDIRVGSQMWNGTTAALNAYGRSKETLKRDETAILPGVLNSNGKENNIEVPLNEYWFGTLNNTFNSSLGTPFVQNSNWVRLRVVTLTYNLNSKIAQSLHTQGASISFIGRNLYLYTPYKGIDPESSLTANSSHAQGLEYFNTPGTRSYAISLSLKF